MRLIVPLAILVAVFALIFGWLTFTGMSARTAPGSIEAYLGRTIQRLSIPTAARSAKNPMDASPDLLVEGRRHFADHCASCHANDGSGKADLGQNLYPRAPDMRLVETQNLTDGELYYIIQNGIRFTGMPAWGAAGPNDHETWHLVLFLRHLPHLTAEDLADMKDHNPRSPAEIEEEQQEEEFLNAQPDSNTNSKQH
ncbi:MAG: c-type cytochrome [Candidatus Acidiferrales bacterium]